MMMFVMLFVSVLRRLNDSWRWRRWRHQWRHQAGRHYSCRHICYRKYCRRGHVVSPTSAAWYR